MNPADVDIDRVVVEVMRRLRRLGGSPPDDSSSDDSANGSASGSARDGKPERMSAEVREEEKTTLRLNRRVVTLDDLRGRLDRVRRLCVPRGAVLTPAARDELRLRDVLVRHEAVENRSAARSVRLLVARGGIDGDPPCRVEHFLPAELSAMTLESTCLFESVREIDRRVGDGAESACLITRRVALALCLANRHPRLRAAAADDSTSLQEAVETLGANVLVVDPRGKSTFQVRRLLGLFAAAGASACPLNHPLLRG